MEEGFARANIFSSRSNGKVRIKYLADFVGKTKLLVETRTFLMKKASDDEESVEWHDTSQKQEYFE